jgi:hypothetical protein
VYESEHKAGETAVCWSQKHQAPFWAKEPGSYMGVSATTNVSGRKTMASTVGAESGDQRKTVVILSDRSREIIRLFEELQRKRRQAEQSPGCGATKQAGPHAKLGSLDEN